MKTIVCYGDSNTWGADPSSPDRFAHDVRWTAVLARELGHDYRVVEEGLNGRTTVVDDINEPNRNGYKQLVPVLESQHPVDLVIIMLGTNDLKARHNRRAADIGQSVSLLANTARSTLFGPQQSRPKVLILCPPPIATLTDYDGLFAGALEKSLEMPRYYELAAQVVRLRLPQHRRPHSLQQRRRHPLRPGPTGTTRKSGRCEGEGDIRAVS